MAMYQDPGTLGTLSHSWLMDVYPQSYGKFIGNCGQIPTKISVIYKLVCKPYQQ